MVAGVSGAETWTVFAVRYEHPSGYFHRVLLPLRQGMSEDEMDAFMDAHRKHFASAWASLVVLAEKYGT